IESVSERPGDRLEYSGNPEGKKKSDAEPDRRVRPCKDQHRKGNEGSVCAHDRDGERRSHPTNAAPPPRHPPSLMPAETQPLTVREFRSTVAEGRERIEASSA